MSKIIFKKAFFLLSILSIIFLNIYSLESKAQEEAKKDEKKPPEIEIDPKWVRMDTEVKSVGAGSMKVERTYQDDYREPMEITIYFDSETKVFKGDEEAEVSDIKQGSKVEIYYQRKWLGDFLKRLGKVIKIKNGKE